MTLSLKIKISNRLTPPSYFSASQSHLKCRQSVTGTAKKKKTQKSAKFEKQSLARTFGRVTILISSLGYRARVTAVAAASVVAPKCISPRLRVYWPRRHPLVALPPLQLFSLQPERALHASFLRASPPARRSPTTTTTTTTTTSPLPLFLPTPPRHFLPPLLTLHPLNESYAAGNRHSGDSSVCVCVCVWLFRGRSLAFFIRFPTSLF